MNFPPFDSGIVKLSLTHCEQARPSENSKLKKAASFQDHSALELAVWCYKPIFEQHTGTPNKAPKSAPKVLDNQIPCLNQ